MMIVNVDPNSTWYYPSSDKEYQICTDYAHTHIAKFIIASRHLEIRNYETNKLPQLSTEVQSTKSDLCVQPRC
jgi:hypothetical protein